MQSYTSEILNKYLFGQSTTPPDLLLNSWADRSSQSSHNVPLSDYMTTGAGRFATGSQSSLVQGFFETSIVIPEGTYTKEEMASLLGIASYGINLQAYEFADATNDYAERALIFNSQAFKLADDVVFQVDASGTRSIGNYSIVPNSSVQENFDFISNDIAAILANSYIESRVDPSGIGHTVNINFTGSVSATSTYDMSDYLQDISNVAVGRPTHQAC